MNTQRIDCGSELFFCVMDEIETLGFPEMPRNMIRHYSVIFLCVNSAGHRHFCLYGFLQHDWSTQNQNKEIWPRGTGST